MRRGNQPVYFDGFVLATWADPEFLKGEFRCEFTIFSALQHFFCIRKTITKNVFTAYKGELGAITEKMLSVRYCN